MFLRALTATLITILAAPIAHAETSGLYISEGLIAYSYTADSSATAVTTRQVFSSETGLGYPIGGVFYVGGTFNFTAANERVTDSLNIETKHQEIFQYYGPTVGYFGDSLFILGSYYANAEKKDTVTSPGQLTQNVDNTGWGWGINVGYRIPLGIFDIAPMLSYKSVTYTTCKDPYSGASSPCNPNVQQSEVSPYVTLLFNFK